MPSDGRLFWIRSTWFLDRLYRDLVTTASHLAEKFCYSVQSARRTINSLRDDFGAPLTYDHAQQTWRLTDPNWTMPDLPLSPDEISAVALARSLVSKISAPTIADPMERFWQKLCMSLSQQSPAGAGFAHAVSARAPAWTQVPNATMETCLRALALERRIHITYLSPWSGALSQRTVEPRHLLLYEGSYYLVAHCLLKDGELRLFNLRALQKLHLTDQPCSDTPFHLHEVIDTYGLMLGGKKTTITLRIHPPRGARAAIETWHPHQHDIEEPDGTLIRSFPVRGLAEVHRLVLSYGASVEVLEPKELRDAIEKETLEMAENLRRRQAQRSDPTPRGRKPPRKRKQKRRPNHKMIRSPR